MTHTSDTNGNTPAAQHDLALLAGRFSERFDHLNERVRQSDSRFDDMQHRIVAISDGHEGRNWESAPDRGGSPYLRSGDRRKTSRYR